VLGDREIELKFQLPPSARAAVLAKLCHPRRLAPVVRIVRANPREAVELCGVLTRGGEALTETWSYMLPRE
jgi:hypothetical protein